MRRSTVGKSTNRGLVIAAAASLLFPVGAGALELRRLEFKTTRPEPLDGFTEWDLYPRSEFGVLAGTEILYPESVPGSALAGWIYAESGRVAAVVFQDDALDAHVTIDWDADGDLRDEPSYPLTPGVDEMGDPACDVVIDRGHWIVRLEVPLHGDGTFEPGIREYGTNLRTGEIDLGGASVRFAVRAGFGRYDGSRQSLFVDLDSDGELTTDRLYSDERFEIRDRRLTIQDRHFEFSVRPDGSALILEETGVPGPERARLEPGNPAPDFTFTDLGGVERRLSDFRGQVVALYFWGTWCGGCRSSTSDLVDIDAELPKDDFVVIGINKGDSRESVNAYVSLLGVDWPQALQGDDGAVLALYRIARYPTVFLLDRDGVIVENDLSRGQALHDAIRTLAWNDRGVSSSPTSSTISPD